MSLTYDYDYDTGLKIDPNVKFEVVARRIADKKRAIDDMQNEYNLLEEQAFYLYKTHVSYIMLGPKVIEGAEKWLRMIESGKDSDGKKLDKRKKCVEKDNYEFVAAYVKKLLGLDDFEFTGIIDYNFSIAKEIEFNSHGHKWELEVPIIKNLRVKHYRESPSCFKLKLYHVGSCLHSCIGSTFEEDDLKDIMAKGIEKYCEVEDGKSKN